MSTVTEEVTEESDIYLEIADLATDNLDIQLNPAIRKPKKKEKKTRVHKKSSMNSEGIYFVFPFWHANGLFYKIIFDRSQFLFNLFCSSISIMLNYLVPI
jgi:hypothetical protein